MTTQVNDKSRVQRPVRRAKQYRAIGYYDGLARRCARPNVSLNMPRKRSRFSCRPAAQHVARLQWRVPCHASWCELAMTIYISLDFRLAATFATSLPQSKQRKPNHQQRWGKRLRRCQAEHDSGQNASAKLSIPNRHIGRNPTARNANCVSKYLDAKRARI